MTEPARPRIERDWLSKTLAGAVLGLTLAFVCSAVFAQLAAAIAPPIRAQLAMWLVIPVWLSALSGVYLFQNGKRAWLWLGAANVAAVLVLASLRLLS